MIGMKKLGVVFPGELDDFVAAKREWAAGKQGTFLKIIPISWRTQ
jgi:hypothetical protein